MENGCTALERQSIETERAYQLHKYVYQHCSSCCWESNDIRGNVVRAVSICPCLLVITTTKGTGQSFSVCAGKVLRM